MPTLERATCSALVRAGDRALLLDAGSGLTHLCQHPQLLDGVNTVDILLTHFHLDHISGLASLPGLPVPAEQVTVHGPGRALYGTATRDILRPLLSPPLSGSRINARCADYDPARGVSLAGLDLELRVQRRHSAPTVGVRIGDELAYCTDTAYDPDTAAFARGVRTLAHDAWWHADAPQHTDVHASGAQCGQLARDAGADQLALIHLHPLGDPVAVFSEALREHPGARLARDLTVL